MFKKILPIIIPSFFFLGKKQKNSTFRWPISSS